MGGRWEGKGTATFFLELTLDLLHLIVYAAFFAVVFSTHGIPLYLVRRGGHACACRPHSGGKEPWRPWRIRCPDEVTHGDPAVCLSIMPSRHSSSRTLKYTL